jgi:hypothetical protein
MFFVFSNFGLDEEWEAPEGYRGWVVLTVANPAYPPLPRRWLATIIRVDQTGRGCTSRRPDRRFRKVTYYSVAADGRRTILPHDDRTYGGDQASHIVTAYDGNNPKQIEVFIGPWAEADRASPPELPR